MPIHHSFLDPMMPQSEPVPGKTYRADGWAYVDIPWVSIEVWEDVIGAMGEDVVILASAAMKKDGTIDRIRGQVLMSPDAQMAITEVHTELSK